MDFPAGNGEVFLGLDALAGASGYGDAATADQEISRVGGNLRVLPGAVFGGPAYLDALGGNVIYFGALGGNGKGAAGNVGIRHRMVRRVEVIAAGVDALAAVPGVGDGERSARHAKVVVGLDAGGSAVLTVFLVPGGAARNGNGVGAVLHQHVVVRADAFFHGGRDRHVKRSAAQLHIVLASDAVPGAASGRDCESGVSQHAEVVVRGDGRFPDGIPGRHLEAAAAAHQELSLGEEHRFHVFRRIGGRVQGRAGIAEHIGAFHHHEGALAALVVDGGPVRAGEIEVIQQQGLLFLAVELETAVGGASGQLIHDGFLARILHGHVLAVHRHDVVVVPLDGNAFGRIGDVDLTGKCSVGNVVFRGIVSGRGKRVRARAAVGGFGIGGGGILGDYLFLLRGGFGSGICAVLGAGAQQQCQGQQGDNILFHNPLKFRLRAPRRQNLCQKIIFRPGGTPRPRRP